MFVMVIMAGFVSLAVDLGRIQLAKTEMFVAVESIARYTSAGLIDGTASSRATCAANDNQILGNVASIAGSDIEVGVWDPYSRTFTATTVDSNAVRVIAYRNQARGNAIHTTFGTLIGISSHDVRATAIAYRNRNVMLVVGNTSLNASDQLVYDRITSFGYHVVVKRDADVVAEDARLMRSVVISESVVSSNVGTKLKSVTVPVVCYEPFLVDDFAMSGTSAAIDYGLSTVANRIDIRAPAHPIANGLSGVVTVSTLSDGALEEYLAWAKIGGDGIQVASIPGNTNRSTVYAYESGTRLADGSIAPARRAGFFGSGPLGAFSSGVPAIYWTSGAWTVFDNSFRWVTGNDPPVTTVRLSR